MAGVLIAPRRSHYENAFEAILRRLGIPFVSASDVRARVPGRFDVKLFDYLVYPADGVVRIVEVKGRKFHCGRTAWRRCRDSWVTLADVAGLERWEQVFGTGYCSAFAFVYWMADAAFEDAADPNGYVFGDRLYSGCCVALSDYQQHLTERSPRWRTVHLPHEDFARLSRPLTAWSSAGAALRGASSGGARILLVT